MAYNMVSAGLIHAIETNYRDTKFTDDDVANHMDWAHDAEKWAEAQIKAGTASDFVKDVMARRNRFGLSKGQYRALMNCVRSEVVRAERETEQLIAQLETGKEPLNLSKVLTGHYAVINDEGEPTFYHIDNIDEKRSKWFGWVFVKQVIGGGNDIRIGSQRPNQNYVGQREEHLKKILENPLEATKLYGREIGECGICGKTLTSEWREVGIGPVCAEKVGVTLKDTPENKLKRILNLHKI